MRPLEQSCSIRWSILSQAKDRAAECVRVRSEGVLGEGVSAGSNQTSEFGAPVGAVMGHSVSELFSSLLPPRSSLLAEAEAEVSVAWSGGQRQRQR